MAFTVRRGIALSDKCNGAGGYVGSYGTKIDNDAKSEGSIVDREGDQY